MARWKIILLREASIGLGIGVGLGVVGVFIVWWSSRPPREIPWNSNAVTAKYFKSDVDSDSFFAFYYSLKNNTDHDYVATPTSNITASATTAEGNLANCENCITSPKDLFIPAHDSLQVILTFKYKYPAGPLAHEDSKRDDAYKALLTYLNDNYSRLNGFVIFDQDKRYRINLPLGGRNPSNSPS